MFRTCAWLIVLAVFCAGCSDAPESTVQMEGPESPKGVAETPEAEHKHDHDHDHAHGHDHDHDHEGEAKAPAKKRTDMAGRWLVAITNYRAGGEIPGIELPAMLVDIKKGENGEFHAELKQYQTDFFPAGEFKLILEEVAEKNARLDFTLDGQKLIDMRADFAEGIARGNMVYGQNNCDPVRFLPTEKESLQGLEPKPLSGSEEFELARKNPEPFTALREFAEKFSTSELASTSQLALAAYVRLVDQAKDQKLDRAEFEKLANNYYQWARQWGSRMEMKAHFDVAVILTHRKYLLDYAVSIFDELVPQLTDELADRWKPVIESQRSLAHTYAAVENLNSEEADVRNKAAEELLALEKAEPFNLELIFALAQFNEKQKSIDDSLKRYAKLAVIPLAERILQGSWQRDEVENPLPSETVARLWKEKHGSTDGLEEFLDGIYQESLHGFGDEKVPPRGAEGGDRVALLEFFTGAECPPCVMADVAVSRLEETYAPSELITLVFQQHIPAPSPLVNEDSEYRLAYYVPNPQERGTPMATLNGKIVEGGLGGAMVDQSTIPYEMLREQINEVLTAKTDIRLQLKAQVVEGALQLSADVEGLKASSQSIRLRMALAEDDVVYAGGNGIRHHSMVVRQMPGGPLGIAQNEGKLSYKKTISVADIRQRLTDYLEAYEQRMEQEFPAKPMELKKLHFVAFVQDDTTHEILQSAAIPVEGDLSSPEAAPASNKPAPPKEEESDNSASEKESNDKGSEEKEATPDDASK